MRYNMIKAVAKKEFKHLVRDIRMLSILIVFPVFLLVVFGYAINFDVHHIKLAVYDLEKSETSRAVLSNLMHSEYFDLSGYLTNDSGIKEALDNKLAQGVLIIPADFSRDFYSGKTAKVQMLLDGVDGNTASIIQNYINGAMQNYSQKLSAQLLERRGLGTYVPLTVQSRFWYNPDLQTTKFLIPGLIAMILIITAAVSVSLSLVREKERGTIEQINVSPVKSFELLAGKIIPYVLLSLLNAAMILVMGYFLFSIEIKGSIILLFFCTLLFLTASTGIGIFVSVIAETQQIAFSISTFATLLPSVILSGFIFPIESMPWIIQVFTNLSPAKFFITILRAIILRGVGISAFWDQALYLVLFTVILFTLSTILNKKKEDRAQ